MSEPTPDEATEAAADADADADDADGDDVPPIEAEERAEIPDEIRDLAEEVEDDVGLSSADADDADADGDDEEAAEADSEEEAAADEPAAGDTATWGDQYVATVGVLAFAAAEQLGEGEPSKSEEDIAALLRAEPLNVDENVDKLVEQMGHGRDIPPGQAVLLGTLAVMATVVLTETDVAGDLIEQVIDHITTTISTED